MDDPQSHHDIWGMGVDEDHIQVTFGSGDRGFTRLTRSEALVLKHQLRREHFDYTLAGILLNRRQRLELSDVIAYLLDP
jgi:hypothetical protein